jgi:hypothetical protein
MTETRRKYYNNNRNKINAKRRENRQKKREAYNAYSREYRKKNSASWNRKKRNYRDIKSGDFSETRTIHFLPDSDDYSDLVPIPEDGAFRSWAVITSQEYAKELTIWQIADMLDGYDDCAMNDWDINGGKHD